MSAIKDLRTGMGLTQERLAEKLGITQGAVAQWESGLSRPSYDSLLRLSDVLGVSVDVLMGRE